MKLMRQSVKPNELKNCSDGSEILTCPDNNEVEVSVFGPGYGEGILVHLGHNNWIVVDSCIDPISKAPAPLLYLKRIGVDPSVSVKQVIVTHWHDDHIRGISKIVGECSSSEFVCSGALKTDEFLTLVNAYGSRSMMVSSGVKEFYEIIKILVERKQNLCIVPQKFAIADRCVFSIQDEPKKEYSVAVHALSPSDEAISKAFSEIAALLPLEKETKRHIIVKSPNYCAVVLWIQMKDVYVLLGSDLEENKSQLAGWSIILHSTTRPQGKASFFKIPHHGSFTADHPDVWSMMLQKDPAAVLTPFIRGKTVIPTDQDIKRIVSRTDNAYITAKPTSKKSNTKRPKAVDRTIKEIVGSLESIHPSVGHVRFRKKINSPDCPWKVDLFGDAMPLQKLRRDYEKRNLKTPDA